MTSDLPAGLSKPALRALTAAGYTRLEQLTKLSEAEVKRLHGMGPRALDLLRRALAADGRSFLEPKVEVRAEQPYAAIPIKVTLKEWGRANALVGEVIGWLSRQGIEFAGAPFFRYWTIGDMDREFDLEVGVPVASVVSGDGRVIAGFIPSGSYATMVHFGHPDRLAESLEALQEWGTRQGLEWNSRGEVWGGRFEFYLTNPAEQPDLEKWSIEIAYQVRDNSARRETNRPRR